jgi:hypothetical protein
MKPNRRTLATLALSALVASCSGTQESGSSHDEHASADGTAHAHAGAHEGVHVDLDQIPTTVQAAAMARMPTLVLVRAERAMEHGVLVYELFGTLNGEPYELEISEFGNVLVVEKGGQGEATEHRGDHHADDENGDEHDDD